MAAVVNTYKVTFHFEQGNPPRKSSSDETAYIQASAGDYTSLKTVLSNNSRIRPGTLVIDSVQEVGHGDQAIA